MKYATKSLNLNFKCLTNQTKSEECVIEGYANTSSKDRVGDVVLPDAFSKSLPTYKNNPILLVNHDWSDVAGVVQDAQVTDKGLYIKARISDTREDLKTLIREGALRTMSIGYNEVQSDVDETTKTKYISELELLEISVVSVPANTEAMFTIAQTKLELPKEEPKPVEQEQKSFESFVAEVKSVAGIKPEMQLGDNLVLSIVDYYNLKSKEEIMNKIQELAKELRAKSLESAIEVKQEQPAPEAPAAAPEAPKPMEEQKPADAAQPDLADMMKVMGQKLDMIAQALASCMEQMAKDKQEDDLEDAKPEAPKEEPKPSEAPAAPEAPKPQPDDSQKSQPVETTEEKSMEATDEEIAALEATIAELEA